jgi:hypothetical protein
MIVGEGVSVGRAVAVEVGAAVSVGPGVGVELLGGKGVGEGVAIVVGLAVGRGVSVGFTSPAGNQARIWLSCEELGLPRMAADTELSATGQKAPTAIKHTTRITSISGMRIRLPPCFFEGV